MLNMIKQVFFLLLISIIFINASDDKISCGSAFKIKHKDTGHHLHSHAIAWGSGSGQQSVTAHGSDNDQG